MRRLSVLLATLITLAALPTAALATHSGQELRASGRGEAAATTQQAPVCLTFVAGFCVQTRTTTTTVSEDFSFDARVSTQTTGAEAHGHMVLDYQVATRTVVEVDEALCAALLVVFGIQCPPLQESDTTQTQQASVRAEVTCLAVTANRASIGGHVTRFSGDLPPTRGLLFFATDNTVARQQLIPDEFAASFVAEAPTFCTTPGADHPITKGDIKIEGD